MRKEHKEILFKDLSTRLPYHVRCKVWLKDGTTEEGPLDLEHNYGDVLQAAFYYNKIVDIKPYLRSMSKMTEEERKDWRAKVLMDPKVVFSDKIPDLYDFCNSHYLDYRKIYDEKDGKWKSMIEMGLALEAPEDMYKLI